MKIISHFITIVLLMLIVQTVQAQYDYKTLEDDYIKGPVYLYKKTVMRDFSEKFGDYIADIEYIDKCFMYDEKGRKIYEYEDQSVPERNPPAYEVKINFFDNDKLTISASKFEIGDDVEDYIYTYYKYPQSTIMEEHTSKGKGFTKTYNSKNLLIEESEYLGESYGHKYVCKYDNNDKKISSVDYNGIGDLEQKVCYKRDAEGNLLEKTIYDAEGEEKNKEIIEYNSAGKKTKTIEYNAEGEETNRIEIEYLNDTLATKLLMDHGGQIFYSFDQEYNENNLLEKTIYTVDAGTETNKYEVYNYNSSGNLISKDIFENQRITGKVFYSNYVGNQYLDYTKEKYNEDGSLNEKIIEKRDKYGNTSAYEKYKYETKFGESVKIPVEKDIIEYLYHDGSPKLTYDIQIVEEKNKNSDGKNIKEDYLKIKIRNATAKPDIHLYDKPGITHYGSSKENKHESGYNFSFQYGYIKGFFLPHCIIEAGDEVIIVKLPYE